ncbi:MAG: MmcQ/YjbR family DNA-binding protein [Bacteroidetes bacterium]|nr:MmcQ/YjbR family DNA-binding protein [Bacteroidota bacterium]
MVAAHTLRTLALQLPEAIELPHFEKTSFRVRKKIFASLDEIKNIACLKLDSDTQAALSAQYPEAIFPVPNKWGAQGWTNFLLDELSPDQMPGFLLLAYKTVAPKSIHPA